MRTHNPFWPEHAFCFLGGGGSPAATEIESAPVPAPAPPVTTSNAEVVAAEQQVASQNLMKKSIKGTILAGDNLGYNPGGNNPANAAPPISTFRKLG